MYYCYPRNSNINQLISQMSFYRMQTSNFFIWMDVCSKSLVSAKSSCDPKVNIPPIAQSMNLLHTHMWWMGWEICHISLCEECTIYVLYILMWGMGGAEPPFPIHIKGPSFERNWIPLTQGCSVPRLVEIGPMVLENLI